MAETTSAGPGRRDVPGYAKVCGILGLILAVLIPVLGLMLVVPLAIILGPVFAVVLAVRGLQTYRRNHLDR